MPEPRGVEERLAWLLNNPPGRAGLCARACWHALGGDRGNPPRWYAADANAVHDKVKASGRYWTTDPPRGALIVWQYGRHGHTALSLGGGQIVTTDPTGQPGGTGVEPLTYPRKWGARDYIWTDTYNRVSFPVGGDDMGKPPYIVKKRAVDQTMPLNEWVRCDIGTPGDTVQPPVGANDWDSYVNLDLKTLKGAARNDLRYLLGRWARHNPGSDDTIEMGGTTVDVTGADTKTIPPDLPRRWWRSTWTHGFKGQAGVPVSFWVYIGSVKDGTVVSPLRIFKVDDET